MRVNLLITVTANAPVNIVTGLNAAAKASDRVMVSKIFIQMATAAAGQTGYVLGGITYGRVPAVANAADVTAELSAGQTNGPGGSYSEEAVSTNACDGIDASTYFVDGLHTGDTIRVSYDVQV